MATILSKTDFVGFHKLAGSLNNDDLLQAWITKYEQQYLNLLFGITLGKAIAADPGAQGGAWTNSDYQRLFEPISEEGDNGEQIESEGVKEILKSCIFWHYVTETSVRHTQAGATLTETDTAIRTNAARYAESKWNNMLNSWDAIHDYIYLNMATYTTFICREKPEPLHDGIL